MIVSEIPGTTRDSVDVRFELDGKTFVAIDTAGVRRHRSIRSDIDFYSFHRAQRSIRRADVVLLFFDCTQRLSKVDKQLCKYVADQYKPSIFVVNKWDLLYGQMPTERWVDYLRDTFPTMWHVPVAFITGQTGKNVKALLNHAQMLFKQALSRVTTGQLNRMLREAIRRNPPPVLITQREEIEVLKLIGATDAFIRRPFYYLGLLQGLVGVGATLLAAHLGAVFYLHPSEMLRWNLDRVQMSYLAAYFLAAAGVLLSVLLGDHAAFAEMLGRQGVAIIDLAHEQADYYGHVVSTFPFTPGKYFLVPLSEKRAGYLVLYSTAHQTVFDTARVEKLP
jgi:small GTP-binding protein